MNTLSCMLGAKLSALCIPSPLRHSLPSVSHSVNWGNSNITPEVAVGVLPLGYSQAP